MKVLVFGFYSKNNAGDDLFKEAFKHLFPALEFYFTDHITINLLKDKDAVFIGGGSFLDQKPDIKEGALIPLGKKPIFYLGVGAETNIHETHQKLMRRALLIAIRSPHTDKIKEINENVIEIPDLVYSLATKSQFNKSSHNSILFLPNIMTVPKWNNPHWMHISWEYYKMEIAQTFDHLIDTGRDINYYAMSSGKLNDEYAAIEIKNSMVKTQINSLIKIDNIDIPALIRQHSLVITQRYHGAILAEIAQVPYICIHHHDKLKSTHYNLGSFIPYFEFSKDRLLKEINNSPNQQTLTIEPHIFRDFVDRVNKCIASLDIKTNE